MKPFFSSPVKIFLIICSVSLLFITSYADKASLSRDTADAANGETMQDLLLEKTKETTPEEDIDPQIKKKFEKLVAQRKRETLTRLEKAEAEYASLMDDKAKIYPLVDYHKRLALFNHWYEEKINKAHKREDILTDLLDKKQYVDYMRLRKYYGGLAWENEDIKKDQLLQRLKTDFIQIISIDEETMQKRILESRDQIEMTLNKKTVPEELVLYAKTLAPINEYRTALEQVIRKRQPKKATTAGREIERQYTILKEIEDFRITKKAIDEFMN